MPKLRRTGVIASAVAALATMTALAGCSSHSTPAICQPAAVKQFNDRMQALIASSDASNINQNLAYVFAQTQARIKACKGTSAAS